MRKKNIILDLDETIISSIDDEEYDNSEYVKKIENYYNFQDYFYMFERPHLEKFLDYVFENFNVSIWTAAHKDYALFIIQNIILKNKNRKLNYIFWTYHCSLSSKKYNNHKQIKLLWEDFKLNEFNENNTIILDDKLDILYNQENLVLNIKPFNILDNNSLNDTELISITDKLESYKNQSL